MHQLAYTLFSEIPKYTKIEDLETFLLTILKDVFNFAMGISGAVALLFIIIGAFRFVTSAGNQEQIELAKKTLTYAIIGLVLIAGAFALVNTLLLLFSGL